MNLCSEVLYNLPIDKIISDVIHYLERTKDEDWHVDFVASQDGKRYCFQGHLFNFGGNLMCDIFHNAICNEFMYYSINDGKNPKYPQETPKLRIIAYLQNLKEGKEKTIPELETEYYHKRINKREKEKYNL